jgi:hypothetical protein
MRFTWTLSFNPNNKEMEDPVVNNSLVVARVLQFLVLIVVAGCGPEVVPSSGPRAPTDPSQVSIYQKEPKRYEILGNVEVAVGGDVRWDSKGEANAGFERLKAQAAARGANGILLSGDSPEMMRVVARYKGTWYQVPVRTETPKTAVAKAIYVLEP